MAKGRAKLNSSPLRGELYTVTFDPVRGREIAKTRPALVIQNDIGNRESDIVIVAAITSHKDSSRLYPVCVFVKAPEGGLKQDSIVRLDQIRSVDKERLGQRLGKLNNETILQINYALKISLGLIEL
ncbi:MAG TPA: type II toxin-antitoxin system PemK/MazF family toxin [Candidatus Paceibacterota bacterium]